MNAIFRGGVVDREMAMLSLSAGSRSSVFTTGVVLVLIGLYLQWRLPDYLSTAEERIKDRQLTEDQARRRVRIYRYTASAISLAGVVLLTAVFLT